MSDRTVSERPADVAGRTSRFARLYGAGPVHLVSLVACFAVAGYAALRWYDSPSAVRLAVWFVGALLLHDFVLFPAYTVLDKAVTRVTRRRRARVPLVNHVRVPVLLSGLLLLLWFPLIFSKSEPAYQSATGLDTAPYLGRWLALTAVFVGVSVLLYVVRVLRTGPSRNGSEAKAAMPLEKSTEADHPSS